MFATLNETRALTSRKFVVKKNNEVKTLKLKR